MKKTQIAAIIGLLAINTAFAHNKLDLEMTGKEYRSLLKKEQKQKSHLKFVKSDIEYAVAMGERLYQWVEAINKTRSPGQELRITSPETRRKFPINGSITLNPAYVAEVTRKNLSKLPADIKFVLLNDVPFPTELSMSDKDFAKHVITVEYNYRDAARYRSLIKWKDDYIKGQRKDVRGYYYLKTNNITAENLRDVGQIEETKLAKIKEALIKICRNDFSESKETCIAKVAQASEKNQLAEHFEKYYSFGEQVWNRFFRIPDDEVRKDLVWSGNTLTVPFQTPTIERFIPFLKNNIEDEFRWNDFSLKMIFGNFETAPTLQFVPGTVPHVPEGNNTIIMDANQSIDEWDTQWVIRHEYGHILGLPDCQHEFYDEIAEGFVAYQLDTEDLMCSRGGRMNERIYLELKRVYGML